DFAELVALHSSHPSKENKGELSMRRLGMSSQFYNAVSALSPGQYSDAVKLADACYILKLLSRVAPSESEFDKVKVSIQKAVRKGMEAKRSDDYLQSLRIRRKVAINEGLLAELTKAAGEMDAGKIRSSDNLVDVGGDVLTAGEFISMLKQSRLKVGVEIINNWIERKLIDQEAVDRNYGKEPDLQGMLNRYENELLRQMFVQKVIQPQVTITEDKLAEYYGSHQQEYMKPGRYKIKSITVANEDDARGIEKSLAEGADFTWLAKRKSADQLSEESVERRWMSRGEFPGKAAELVDSMKIGDVSPVIRTPMGRFMIFELEDKQEGQVEGLDRVRDAVRQAYFSQQMNGLLQKYLKQLRESTETRVFKGRIQALESGLQK
ncbi:MAG TPA: peptidyl-prolyl cis-trans isomerase, partial [Thermodesulfovibrionales bacterium]|nr:peptidyl-prolyl cis-trans isomerase [Thermodesulfovibrionales bacterium]